jgi:hypothetical protein
MPGQPPFKMERLVPLSQAGRAFDIEYWQRLGPQAILEAAWQMVLDAHCNGKDGAAELRMDRTVEKFQRLRR